MTTPEDRLAALLREEADTLTPAGDGLTRIRARVARRRRLRWTLVPSAALGTAAAVVAAFVLTGSSHRSTLTVDPGATPTPTVSSSPAPSPEPTSTNVYDGPALTAYTSSSKDDVLRHWLASVGITATPATHDCESCDQVGVAVAGKVVGTASFARNDRGADRTYSLVSVTSEQLVVTSPTAGEAVASPQLVRGTVPGVDEHVALSLRDGTGHEVGTADTQAGGAQPWQASVAWTSTSWTDGALLAVTRSMKDGSINRLVAVPVRRGQAAATFAALVDGHVALLDATTGRVVRQLTYPPAGATDSFPAWNGSTLLWVRERPGGCSSELERLDGGAASNVVPATAQRTVANPAVSADGRTTGWVETDCSGSTSVVLNSGGGPQLRFDPSPGQAVRLDDVSDSGAALVLRGGAQAVLLPTAATTWDDGVTLAVDQGCDVGSGAFDGETALLWAACGGSVRLLRYSAVDGTRTSATTVTGISEAPERTAVRDGKVLVQLFGGDTVGQVALLDGSRLTTLVRNDGCTSVGEPKGCVRSPSW